MSVVRPHECSPSAHLYWLIQQLLLQVAWPFYELNVTAKMKQYWHFLQSLVSNQTKAEAVHTHCNNPSKRKMKTIKTYTSCDLFLKKKFNPSIIFGGNSFCFLDYDLLGRAMRCKLEYLLRNQCLSTEYSSHLLVNNLARLERRPLETLDVDRQKSQTRQDDGSL